MDNLKRFECKICKKRFRQLEPLESHMRAEKHNYASGDHSPSTSDRPPIPKLILNLKELRKVTSQKKSQNQEKIITCLFCDKVFSGFNKLVDHAPHDKSEIFRAKDGSNSTWPNADALYRHKHRVHSKPRYKCSACCQIFKGYEAFRKHRSEVHKSKMVEGRHTIKGLLVCTQEERQRRTSTFHKKFADDEQRFECNYCRYKCHEYSRLENHMKGHTREGPFVCSECAAGYALRSCFRDKKLFTESLLIEMIMIQLKGPNQS